MFKLIGPFGTSPGRNPSGWPPWGEWTDATWNPVTGCDRISPGCQHCYALTLAKVQDVLPMSDPITVVSYDPVWPEIFRQLGAQLRAALGGVALRIDHIGSTAVPSLAAKPIVDVQISVERLEPAEPFRSPMEAAGFVYRASNTERTKRYFREPPGQRRTHVHVRRAGSFSEQFALLFRDFLRADPAAALDYGQRKVVLAARFAHDRQGYLNAKIPIIWDVLRRAEQWAQETGWEPGPSDA